MFQLWLARQTSEFRAGIGVIAMDGFTGFKTAAAEEIPQATTVMDPFDVLALAGEKVEQCHQ